MAKAKHTIRIISGTHRSRRLPVLDFDGLRPTGDRVRETLFNWLQPHIAGMQVLDLCAGTGALGFEAASRGAEQALLVEKNTSISKQLQAIQKDFQFNNAQVLATSAHQFMAMTNDKFDLVFMDPPFALNIWQELTELAIPLINPQGFLYREVPTHVELPQLAENWQLYRQKKCGQVKIELWKKLN